MEITPRTSSNGLATSPAAPRLLALACVLWCGVLGMASAQAADVTDCNAAGARAYADAEAEHRRLRHRGESLDAAKPRNLLLSGFAWTRKASAAWSAVVALEIAQLEIAAAALACEAPAGRIRDLEGKTYTPELHATCADARASTPLLLRLEMPEAVDPTG